MFGAALTKIGRQAIVCAVCVYVCVCARGCVCACVCVCVCVCVLTRARNLWLKKNGPLPIKQFVPQRFANKEGWWRRLGRDRSLHEKHEVA